MECRHHDLASAQAGEPGHRGSEVQDRHCGRDDPRERHGLQPRERRRRHTDSVHRPYPGNRRGDHRELQLLRCGHADGHRRTERGREFARPRRRVHRLHCERDGELRFGYKGARRHAGRLQPERGRIREPYHRIGRTFLHTGDGRHREDAARRFGRSRLLRRAGNHSDRRDAQRRQARRGRVQARGRCYDLRPGGVRRGGPYRAPGQHADLHQRPDHLPQEYGRRGS